MTNFKKLLKVGTTDTGNGRWAPVYVTVKFENVRLSITGVVGPLAGGNALGSCGQIDMSVKPLDIEPGDAWAAIDIEKLWAIWERWHLNDVIPGDAAQMAWLRDNPQVGKDYETRKAALAAAGLGDHYGSKWWMEEVPADVLAWLQALPDSPNPLPPGWSRG